MTTNSAEKSAVNFLTLLTWTLIAVLEGVDLQSAGAARMGITAEFGFNPAEMGWILTTSTIGIVVGAAIGGRLADMLGRKSVLIWSVAVFGVFSLASAHAWDIRMLIAARFLTGLGMGAAMPNLVALVGESSGENRRNLVISIMYSGMPIGAALCAYVAYLFIPSFGWRIVFYLGGFGPLLIVPLMIAVLKESPVFGKAKTASQRVSAATAFFGENRTGITLALWAAAFFSLFVHYMLLNWLPALLSSKGFSPQTTATFLIFFNLGGVAGMLVSGVLLDFRARAFTIVCTYIGLIAVLIGLNQITDLSPLVVVIFAADICTSAAIIILYAMPTDYYAVAFRGTGLGGVVSAGRLGAIAGPLAAGYLLAGGMAGTDVVLVGIPGLIVAALLLLSISRRPRVA